MWLSDTARLDLDHTEDRQGYQGLAHRGCNRRAGQAKAQHNRSTATRITRSRNW